MKRKDAIVFAKVAGYHSDSAWFTRLIIEARVNRQTMNEAWRNGVSARNAGVRCECIDCKRGAQVANAPECAAVCGAAITGSRPRRIRR